MTGHCSKCGKIWTLDTKQGVCQWCERPAVCQTTRTQALRIKSRSNSRKRQAPVSGNGYDQLEGDWLTYYKVAEKYVHKAQAQDREDLLHTIILNLAIVGKSNGHKPDNLSWMYRIASFTVAQYWRDYYQRINGIDCGHCSNQQRKKCKQQDLYSECPRAIRIESLNKPIVDGDGHITELWELIADNKAIDLPDWQDEKTWQLGYPQRLVDIAEKIDNGENLTAADSRYLYKFRKKAQKSYWGGDFSPSTQSIVVEAPTRLAGSS